MSSEEGDHGEAQYSDEESEKRESVLSAYARNSVQFPPEPPKQ